jgi:type IV pilus assembly protein PilB
MSKALIELLAKEKIISTLQSKEALDRAKPGESLLGYILEKGFTNENKVLYFFSQRFSLSSINLQKFEIRPEVLKLVSSDLVRKLKAIPIQAKAETLVVAIYDPTIVESLEPLRISTKMNVEPVLTSYSSFYAALSKYYGGGATVIVAVENFKKQIPQLSLSRCMILTQSPLKLMLL